MAKGKGSQDGQFKVLRPQEKELACGDIGEWRRNGGRLLR
jgi:hypothetical protein